MDINNNTELTVNNIQLQNSIPISKVVQVCLRRDLKVLTLLIIPIIITATTFCIIKTNNLCKCMGNYWNNNRSSTQNHYNTRNNSSQIDIINS